MESKHNIIFEGFVPEPTRSCADACWTEDGGMALMATVPYPCEGCEREDCTGCDKDDQNGMFVELRGWDERDIPQEERHPEFRQFIGKRVRVTVEVIE
jgi:hypothetical protein